MRQLELKMFIITLLTTMLTCNIFSQVTISNYEKKIDTTYIRPEPYDSLSDCLLRFKPNGNFELEKSKIYIGTQFYLPPLSNEKNDSLAYVQAPILYTQKFNTMKIDTQNRKSWLELGYHFSDDPLRLIDKVRKYNGIATNIYKPFLYQIKETENNIEVSVGTSKEIGDRYYTLINLEIANPEKILQTESDFKELAINRNYLAHYSILPYGMYETGLFTLKDNISGDTVYCTGDLSNFICVPYFIKQKKIFEKNFFIYTGSNLEKTNLVTTKKFNLENGSKWLCKEVTLIKNGQDYVNGPFVKYKINYVLINNVGNTIFQDEYDWGENSSFIAEEKIIEQEINKKLKEDEIIANQKQVESENKRKKQIEYEKRKTDCIALYGESDGSIIAQNKVKIGFNLDMCKLAWGSPFNRNKTTTELKVYEDWYYAYGRSLHFENGILKTIEEK